jgi:hypothetical protein
MVSLENEHIDLLNEIRFNELPTDRKKIVLQKFINKHKTKPEYKDELYAARKLLKQYNE